MNQEEILERLYNAFDPFEPLHPGDPAYVDCRAVRGDEDILIELGRKMPRTNRQTCQLFSGHRGAGKSTELLRLKEFLESKQFFVVYFAADAEDIESEDAQYTDILLACTRHLLESLKDHAEPRPLLDWMKSRWQELKGLALTKVEFDKLDLSAQIAQFAKITANLRAVPNLRSQIREKVDCETTTLTQALNEFIVEAKNNLPDGRTKLAMIVDNLDRIVPVEQPNGQTNHDDIFLNRCEQLKALDCHVIYTIPISMLYSQRATELRSNYGESQILSMIMVRDREGKLYEPGFDKVKEIISKRIQDFAGDLVLETEMFDSLETLEFLCKMSGGHVRNLLLLIQSAIDYVDRLPISRNAINRSVAKARDTYRRTVESDQWELLAKVAASKQIDNDDQYRSLLFSRCILEYRYEGERWHDVHPLIRDVPEFKQAVARMNQ